MSAGAGVESEAQTAGKAGGSPGVSVGTTVAAPPAHVWEVLVSPQGSAALLGDGALLGAKGEPYRCADGTHGVVRSYHPLEQLRVSWHDATDGPASIVEVDLRDADGGTRLDLTHGHLPEGADEQELAARWRRGLDAVAAAAQA